MMNGTHIALVGVPREHEHHYLRWFNSLPVQRTSGLLPMPGCGKRSGHWSVRRLMECGAAVWFTVIETQSGNPVAFRGARDINDLHRTAEYFIANAEDDARGKGYRIEATFLTLRYAFGELHPHDVLLDVSSASLAGIRAYEKAGFRVIRRRTECVRGNQPVRLGRHGVSANELLCRPALTGMSGHVQVTNVTLTMCAT